MSRGMRRGVGATRQYGTGRISKNRVAWLRTSAAQFNLLRYPQESIDQEDEMPRIETEEGDNVMLLIPQRAGRPCVIHLTGMTYDEFDKTRQLFNLMFKIAEPIVKHRDKVAEDASANGDDSYSRIYRAVPEFVVRQGALATDSQGLRNRPQDDAQGTGHDGNSEGGDGGSGEQLADGQPEADRSQDYPT